MRMKKMREKLWDEMCSFVTDGSAYLSSTELEMIVEMEKFYINSHKFLKLTVKLYLKNNGPKYLKAVKILKFNGQPIFKK
jgi:hypothetical protein